MTGWSLTDWLSVLSALGVIVALIANLRGLREKDERKATELTEMRSDIKHIRGQVDKSDVLMADVRTRLGDVKERVTRVEVSLKNTQERLRILEAKEGEGG
mgnify:FL=1